MINSFDELAISPDILQALTEEGYTAPTEIQSQAIPIALEGRDLLGCAQTGTGKTAAFAIPILEKLSSETFSREPRCLVLTPTRELCQQVADFFERYGRHLKLRIQVVTGGMPMRPQIRTLKDGCDIVIATPGRLLDLWHQRYMHFSHVEIVVLDEADRMLDMGFIPDVRTIMRQIPKKRQTLLFSATLAPEIESLARDFMREPERIQVAPPSTPVDRITQLIYPVDFPHHERMLDHLLQTIEMQQVLVFTRTKVAADSLYEYLRARDHDVEVIHGDLRQRVRTRALESFRDKSMKILVATDVASRGLDIEDISHVINFEMPATLEDYIHRIGRTARAEAEGVAISMVTASDWDLVKQIEAKTGAQLERVIIDGMCEKSEKIFMPAGGRRSGHVRPSLRRRSLFGRRRR